jgi:pimeloyl-ACP methyl ester carboxylesterase
MNLKNFLCAALAAAVSACSVAPHPITVPVNGGSLFIDDGGGRSGIPIVLIHGNGGSSAQWRSQLEHFRSSGRRAIAIDLPGFGRSTAPANGDLSLDAMAAAIDRAVDAIGVGRFVIAGHSYGGAVVAKYAALHPQKVAGVVYVDAAAMKLPLTKEQADQLGAAIRADKMRVVNAWFAPMLKPSSESVQKVVLASVENTSADSFLGALMSLTEYDAKALVGAYTGPRLAIAAADIESPASFQLQFPEIRVVKISGAGHWLMLDKPEEVNAALDAFLGALPR